MKESEKIRLNKIISHNTKYSRREADELIKNGDVTIDGKVVSDLSTKVDFKDKIRIKDRRLYKKDHFSVIVYHKQKGELVTKKDDRGRKTVFDSLPKQFQHYMSIGRLDFASEGILLLTDSPNVATALMQSNLERVYYLKINGSVTPAMEDGMKEGVFINSNIGGHKDSHISSIHISPFLAYKIIKNSPTFSKLKVAINEGKNRELRRFFAFFDSEVTDLKRVSFGGIDLGMLKPGKNRYLSKSEYQSLHDFIHKKRRDEKKS